MGLDIAYFKNAKPVEPPEETDEIRAWAAKIGAIRYYTIQGQESALEGIDSEWVTAEYAGGFRAGSYRNYGAWRSLLSRAVLGEDADEIWRNPGLYAENPFLELIDFADNEGAIGPVVSEKLAKDFAKHRETFAMATDVRQFDLDQYDWWAKAFDTVAGNGFVYFC